MDVLLDFESRYHFGILVAYHDAYVQSLWLTTIMISINFNTMLLMVSSSMLLLKTTNTFCIFVIFIIDGTVSNGIDVGSGDEEVELLRF
jgi:hypothetical protein